MSRHTLGNLMFGSFIVGIISILTLPVLSTIECEKAHVGYVVGEGYELNVDDSVELYSVQLYDLKTNSVIKIVGERPSLSFGSEVALPHFVPVIVKCKKRGVWSNYNITNVETIRDERYVKMSNAIRKHVKENTVGTTLVLD